MFIHTLRRGAPAALLLAGCLVGLAPSPAAEEKLADADVAAWVHKRVQDWQPAAADRRFDEIGWAADIRTAERLAKEHDRLVFLFTHDGHVAVGRC